METEKSSGTSKLEVYIELFRGMNGAPEIAAALVERINVLGDLVSQLNFHDKEHGAQNLDRFGDVLGKIICDYSKALLDIIADGPESWVGQVSKKIPLKA